MSKVYLLCLFALFELACAKGSVGLAFNKLSSPASQLKNNSGVGVARQALNTPKPTFDFFKMRFLSVYLQEDMDQNQTPIGSSPIVYLNPECNGDHDTNGCNLEGSGAANEVKSYFDFTDSATVNATINGQKNAVPVGKYKYISMEFCIGDPVQPNINYQLTGGKSRFATLPVCGIHSVKMDPPLEVVAGKTVTVNLNYDFNDWLSVGDGTTSPGNKYDAVHLCDLDKNVLPRPPGETPQWNLGWCVMVYFTPTVTVQ